MQIFKKNGYIFIYLAISLVLTFIWFKDGNPMGGGEPGNPYYNLSKMVGITSWAWGNHALGGASGTTVASGPLFIFFDFLQSNQVPGFLLQAGLFFLILCSIQISMFLLTKEILPKYSSRVWFIAGLFYLFNPYSLVNVWNRFLPNPMVFYGLIPFALWLYLKGIFNKKYSYAVILSIITAIFSYAFGAPAQTAIFWFVILLVTLYYFFLIKKDRFVFKYLLVFLITWPFLNFWWVSQEIYYRFSHAYETATGLFFTDLGNQSTLTALSNSLGQLSNLFLLKHGTFYIQSKDLPFGWPLVYNSIFSLILMWGVTLWIFFIAIKKREDRWVGFLFLFLILSIFISKGNNHPFGEFFTLAFQEISIIQFFRNPFEKLGLLIPLAMSPLFGVAVIETYKRLSKISSAIATLFYTFVLAYLLGYLGFPFWSGLVFSSGNPPANNPEIGYQVKPPEYYKEADKWLSSNNEDFRLIIHPIGGEGIFNKWPKGYAGIEQSFVLLSKPSISYNTTIPYYHEITSKLEQLLLTRTDFYRVASLLNVKYLALRPDIDFKRGGMRDPESIDKIFEQRISSPSANLTKSESFGELKFYKFDDNVILPKIYPSNSLIASNKIGDLEDLYFGNSKTNDSIVEERQYNKFDQLQDSTKTLIIHPDVTFRYFDDIEFPFTNDNSILPFTSRTAKGFSYKLVILKEKINELLSLDPSYDAVLAIGFMGKRLMETKNALDVHDYQAAEESLRTYKSYFEEHIDLFRMLRFSKDFGEQVWRPQMFLAFSTNVNLLREFLKVTPKGSEIEKLTVETLSYLEDQSSQLKITPKNHLSKSDNFSITNRQVFRFIINEDGKFELIIPEKKYSNFFEPIEQIEIQINDQVSNRAITVTEEGYISLGEFDFKKGSYEIGFNLPSTKNLIENQNEITMKASSDKHEVSFPINNFDPYASYLISFDYKVKSGNPPTVSIVQNTDPKIDIKLRPLLEKSLSIDDYWFDYRNYATIIKPSPSADSADIVFIAEPWNDCFRLLTKREIDCTNPNILKDFNRPSEIQIKNLNIKKAFFDEPILKKIKVQKIEDKLPEITFNKINQTKYSLVVKESNEPFLLVFSELFNPDWRALIKDNGVYQEINNDKHILVNGFGNGWLIDKKGDFEMIIEFWPQKLLVIGYVVSGISIIVAIFSLIFIKLKEKK